MKPPKYRVKYRVVVDCPGCGFKFYVVVFYPAGIPAYLFSTTPPRMARIIEKLRKCLKCGRQLGNPRVVDVRWSA